MALDCQRPKRRMMSVSTWAHRSAMAPPARSNRALMSLGTRPMLGQSVVTAKRSVSVISFVVTARLRWVGQEVARGVAGVALCFPKHMARHTIAITGQQRRQPLRPWSTTSPQTQFFCGKSENGRSGSNQVRV
jgi:hypothetical protein